jgi:hypothetical protein
MHWYTSLLEGADASCALRLGKAPELTKAKERVRTVAEPNFIVASDMRNYAPSNSGRTDDNSAEIAHVDGKGSISGVSRNNRAKILVVPEKSGYR